MYLPLQLKCTPSLLKKIKTSLDPPYNLFCCSASYLALSSFTVQYPTSTNSTWATRGVVSEWAWWWCPLKPHALCLLPFFLELGFCQRHTVSHTSREYLIQQWKRWTCTVSLQMVQGQNGSLLKCCSVSGSWIDETVYCNVHVYSCIINQSWQNATIHKCWMRWRELVSW